MKTSLLALSLLVVILAAPDTRADTLESGFRNPPHSAGIRCFWWWLNSNVTKEAISRDLEEMKAKGFNGAMIFDADGSNQRGNTRTKSGPVFGSPQWIALLLHACLSLDRPLDVSQLTLRGRPKYGPRTGEIQLSTDKRTFRTVATFGLKDGQTLNARFPAQKASHIRLSCTSAYDPNPEAGRARNVQVAEIVVPGVTGGADMVASVPPLKDLGLKNAARALGMSAPDTRFLLETEPGKPGETFASHTDIHNLTTKLSANGMLNWESPAGRWEILRIGHTATGAHVSTHSEG